MHIDFRRYLSCVLRQYEDVRGVYNVRQFICCFRVTSFFSFCIIGQVLLSQLITEQLKTRAKNPDFLS